jgi:NAD(P)-dependent dehydrogenase (short-subunit alcohol dehydrogenase family)
LVNGRSLAGRHVVVVGGGSQPSTDDGPQNNGGAISALCGSLGAAVAVVDIDGDSAANTVAHITSSGGTGCAIVADVADPEQCDRLIDEAADRLGEIDGLVVNVGVGEGLGMAGTTVEMWDNVLAVNLRAHFLVARRSLPLMTRGSIVFVGSAAGLRPGTFSPSYDASKAALFGLSRHVALEGAPRGIRANVVAPGLIDTPMGRAASRHNPKRDRVRIALGRQGTPQEVARAVVFLLSEQSSYVTAETLVVDGGLTTLTASR